VLDFQRGQSPRNYFSRREQRRLLLLVMMLGLVLFLVGEARHPENFAWLWSLGQRPAAPQASLPPAGAARQGGAFGGYFPGVTPRYLKEVRDDFPFVTADVDAWFQLLHILRGTDAEKLAAASIGQVTYVQMLQQPEEYRGRLVTLRGIMRRANRVPAPENDYGFEHYYQTWITPQDDPNNLVVVYCLSLPEGFPNGMKLEESVELEGFFFKRWVYQAQDKPRTAPVVLAKTVVWHKRPAAAAPPVDESPISILTMVLVAVFFALSVTAYVYYRTVDRPRSDTGDSVDEQMLRESEILPGLDQSLKNLADEGETRRT
jgi:hypothetical protein